MTILSATIGAGAVLPCTAAPRRVMSSITASDPTSAFAAPARLIGYTLFFLLLFVPTAYTSVKGALMLGVLAAVAWQALSEDRLRLEPAVAAWTLAIATVGLFFMLRGMMRGAPGALRVGTVYVVWPFVYLLFVAGAADARVLRGLVRVAVYATIAISLYAFSYLLHAIGVLPSVLYVPLEQGQAVGVYAGFVELSLHSLASLLFLVPFVLACLMTWPADVPMPVRRGALWWAAAGGSLVVILSGRRALLLTLLIAPVVAIALRGFLPARLRRSSRPTILRFVVLAAAGLGAVLAYLATLGITPATIAAMFLEGFDFSGDYGASLRRLQLEALLGGWSRDPILGAGHGAGAPGFLRSAEMPWAYELSYAALLFHVGLLGFIAYASAVGWVFVAGVRVVRSADGSALFILPALVGTACFLMANATNPYLEKFDFIWVIFFPLCFVNFSRLHARRS